MQELHLYFLLFSLVFFINIIPAFMPPTWVILSYFYIVFNLAFFPVIVLGVIAATQGRVLLTFFSRTFLRSHFPKKYLLRYEHLGSYLNSRQKLTIPIVLAYAFSPISSNTLFIIAGLSNMKINVMVIAFIIGRTFSYTFWLLATYQISKQLSRIISNGFLNRDAFLSSVLSLAIILIVGLIPWHLLLPKHNLGETS